jgi:hypothetical protein
MGLIMHKCSTLRASNNHLELKEGNTLRSWIPIWFVMILWPTLTQPSREVYWPTPFQIRSKGVVAMRVDRSGFHVKRHFRNLAKLACGANIRVKSVGKMERTNTRLPSVTHACRKWDYYARWFCTWTMKCPLRVDERDLSQVFGSNSGFHNPMIYPYTQLSGEVNWSTPFKIGQRDRPREPTYEGFELKGSTELCETCVWC